MVKDTIVHVRLRVNYGGCPMYYIYYNVSYDFRVFFSSWENAVTHPLARSVTGRGICETRGPKILTPIKPHDRRFPTLPKKENYESNIDIVTLLSMHSLLVTLVYIQSVW